MSTIGIETGQQLRRDGLLDAGRREALPALAGKGACPDCGSSSVAILQEEAAFIAVCSGCADCGPDQPSVYDALMDWRRRTGMTAPAMVQSLLQIVTILVLSATAIGMISLIFG